MYENEHKSDDPVTAGGICISFIAIGAVCALLLSCRRLFDGR